MKEESILSCTSIGLAHPLNCDERGRDVNVAPTSRSGHFGVDAMMDQRRRRVALRKRSFLLVFGATLGVLSAPGASAHDIWLLPDRFQLEAGETLVVRQLAGSGLEVEVELELLRRMTPRFELITSAGSVDLLAELADFRTRPVVKPVLERQLNVEGQTLLVMDHAFIHHKLTGEKFLDYLEHEELDVEDYRKHLKNGSAERERYARTMKCLIQVGAAADGELHRRPVGQRLEILLLQNPYRLDPGGELEFQVLFEGEPLEGQLVTAFNRDSNGTVSKSHARTDSEGIGRFRLHSGGFWLLRLVRLIPCSERPDVDCSKVQWESHWTSYAFHLD